MVSKLAYETATFDQAVRPGKQETRDFKLEASPSALAGKLSRQMLAAPKPVATPKPTRTSVPAKGAKGTKPAVVVRPHPGALHGTVGDAKSGRPVSGASVSLSGGGHVATGSSGTFALDHLAPGSYKVLVRRSGFRDATAAVTVRAGQTTNVGIRLVQQPVRRIPVR